MSTQLQLTLDTILSENAQPSSAVANVKFAVESSLFLKRLLTDSPDLLQALITDQTEVFSLEDMRAFLYAQEIQDEVSLKHSLRQLRQQVIARLITRDLNQLADLDEVMLTTSLLAEVTVQTAICYLSGWLSEQYGLPSASDENPDRPQTLMVVGMGKLGGYELNVSSDIDLIFAYEQAGETDGDTSISNQEYFTKVSQQLISAIDEVTEDGFVFRVDMRLRPYGSEGALVCSLDALENYYQVNGREWERYAWIKGRVIVGDGKYINRLLMPFVFRKYLDYGAIASMRDLKKQIQQEVTRNHLHDNIKLGRGGIREIEFIAQVFQLMRGGHEPSLQVRPTLEALGNLTKMGFITDDVRVRLKEAYIFLRNLEHRLQYYEDAQTHELPKTESEREVIARAMRFDSWDALLEALNAHRAFVSNQFDKVFASEESTEQCQQSATDVWQALFDDKTVDQLLLDLGYDEPKTVNQKIHQFKDSFRVKHLPDISQQRLNEVMPIVVELCGQTSNPTDTLTRMIDLIETICQRASYLAFFVEFPTKLKEVVNLVSASPWIASYLSQHPALLDSLIENQHNELVVDEGELESQLLEKMHWLEGDTEQQMNVLRDFQQQQLFSLASRDVITRIPLTNLSEQLSNLADIILRVVIKTVWPTIRGRHCESPKFAIIAYGKHGGLELGYSSDLDMVFLYQDDHPDAREVYTRFGIRVISWLNTMTSSGILYETDMELRPDGNSGLLVVSVDSFRRYQFEKAWVWEHQAITRARFAVGDVVVGQAFEAIREEVLLMPRDDDQLKANVLDMRDRIKSAYKYREGDFDLKKSLGGMIDIEFIVQYLVLVYAKTHPSLIENSGNINILKRCSEHGLIPVDLADAVAVAYLELRRRQHALRLQGQLDAKVPEETMYAIIQPVRKLWQYVFYGED